MNCDYFLQIQDNIIVNISTLLVKGWTPLVLYFYTFNGVLEASSEMLVHIDMIAAVAAGLSAAHL